MSRASGSRAEDLAAEALTRAGYRIVCRNYLIRGGEIDVIAWDGKVLCFVEVRARKSAKFGTPEETISASKRRRIIGAARHYLATKTRGGDVACRFDVVALEGDQLRIVKDAFRLD